MENQQNWQFDKSKKPVTPDMLRLFDGLTEPDHTVTASVTQPTTTTVSVEPTVHVGEDGNWNVIHTDKTEPIDENTSDNNPTDDIVGDSPSFIPYERINHPMPNAVFNPVWKDGACVPEMIKFGGIQYTITGFDENIFKINDVFNIIDKETGMKCTGCYLTSIDGITLEFKYIDQTDNTVKSLILDMNDIANGKFEIFRLLETDFLTGFYHK